MAKTVKRKNAWLDCTVRGKVKVKKLLQQEEELEERKITRIIVKDAPVDTIERLKNGEPVDEKAHFYISGTQCIQAAALSDIVEGNDEAIVVRMVRFDGVQIDESTKMNSACLLARVCKLVNIKVDDNSINGVYVDGVEEFKDFNENNRFLTMLRNADKTGEPVQKEKFQILKTVKTLKAPYENAIESGTVLKRGKKITPVEIIDRRGVKYGRLSDNTYVLIDGKSVAKAEKVPAKPKKKPIVIRKDIEHYWQDRVMQENIKNLELSKAEMERLLKKLYKEQSEELRDSIEKTFLKIMRDKEDGQIMINDLFLTNRYHELLKQFNKCADKLGGEQVKITEEELIKVYKLAQQTIDKYMPKGKFRTSFIEPENIDVKQAIHHTWCLDGREFSDRIWKSKKDLLEKLQKNMTDSVARGLSPFQIADDIVKSLDTDYYCAYRIARTETAHAQIKGQVDKYKQMGFTHGRFVATEPCDDCAALDGLEFTLDELLTMIPKHPNCECCFKLVV